MSEKGKLIGIGVSPENVETLSLEAIKTLETVPVIYSQQVAEKKEGIALSIIDPILEKREDYKKLMIIEPVFPVLKNDAEQEQYWKSASSLIANYLDTGRDVAFVTLDDHTITQIFDYIKQNLKDSYEVVIL